MDPTKAFLTFYDPEFYDREIGPGSRVTEIYRELALEEGGPVLDLGCGTGNILMPIVKSDIEVWGLDASEAMLARAMEKIRRETPTVRVELVQGYMQTFRLDRQFRQIFLANEAIEHLLHGETLLQTFQRCREHLLPGGRLVLDTAAFDVRYLAKYSDAENSFFRHRGLFSLNETESIQVWERTVYNPHTFHLTAHFRYETLQDGKLVETFERTLLLRPRSADEVRFALLAAGFIDAEVSTKESHGGVFVMAR